jgi:hypothetical protein
VQQIRSDRSLRLAQAIAMTRQENVVVAIKQNFERRFVVGHAPLGRCDDGRVPRHHVIAREDDPAAIDGKAEMIRRMSRRMDRR